MSLNVEEPYKEEEVLYQVQVRLNSRGRERVLKVKVYDCAPPLYIHSWAQDISPLPFSLKREPRFSPVFSFAFVLDLEKNTKNLK